ncbi:MAG: hypothetical protein VB111_00725 [Clostridiaceae bacterium]|nr:hypothetical protein [Clostridiaceae bacterium]
MYEKVIEIITGRYGKGTPDDNKIVDLLFGGEDAKERFELYFHWYNLIHELGHGLMWFNSDARPHPVNEEQLVNDFAVAYWSHYGEKGKLDELGTIVTYALEHLKCPVGIGTTHVEYAFEKWGTKELYNFNNYGWFQFSCVKSSLFECKTLESILPQMGVENIRLQPKKELSYLLTEEDSTLRIIEDAVCVLREWGAILSDAIITFDNDPNRHMCNIIYNKQIK